MPVRTYYSVNGQIRGELAPGETDVRDYMTDNNGTVVCVFQNDWGIAEGVYTPYGGVIGEYNLNNYKFSWQGANGYRKTGMAWTKHYVRARHYGSAARAWTSRDPLWPNEMAYGYVNGRPMKLNDPSGMWCGATEGDWNIRDQFNQAVKDIFSDPNFNNFIACLEDATNTYMIGCESKATSTQTTLGAALDDWIKQSGTQATTKCVPNVTIIQDTGGWFSHCKDQDHPCAATQVLSRGEVKIYVCEKTWKDKKCGDLKCVLAHELIHAMSRGHKIDEQGIPDDMIGPFRCIDKLKGRGCFGATDFTLGPV